MPTETTKKTKKVIKKQNSTKAKDAKSVPKKTPKKRSSKETVVLPSKVSSESMKKASAIRRSLSEELHRSVYLVAYVTAFCFILVGATVSLTGTFSNNLNYATVVESGSVTEPLPEDDTKVVEQVVKEEEKVLPAPKFDFETSLPNYLTNEIFVKFHAEGLEYFDIQLKQIETGKYLPLHFQQLDDVKFKLLLDPYKHELGYYRIVAKIRPLDGSGEFVKTTREFFMGSREDEERFLGIQEEVKTSLSETTNSETEVVEADEIIPETEPSTTYDKTELPADEEAVDDSEKAEVLETEEPKESVETNDIAEKIVFKLRPVSEVPLNKLAVLGIETDSDLEFVELYARPINALRYQFVTLASYGGRGWQFNFDSTNLPNGEYEFFAKAKSKFNYLESETLTLKVRNFDFQQIEEGQHEIESIKASEPVDNLYNKTSTIDKEDEGDEGEVELDDTREFVNVEEFVFDPINSETKEIEEKVQETVNENVEDIEKLLRIYAVAVQSGDESIIREAKKELKEAREEIAERLIEEGGTSDKDEVATEFERRIVVLEDRVDTFEEIRKERSAGETAKDSDGDGISDFDERNIYRTDPNSADSDKDGVIDGVEVVRGFNPSSDEAEAVIRYESPKDYKVLERDDILKVEAVPVVTDSSDTTKPPVRTEIKGQGLPNSYVTIFIFSEPTVITVKTDADGSFVYTFDRELEDGEHEVYVAVTDNAGSIIAQSKPFAFVKTAQAFSPVEAAEDTTSIASTQEVPESSNSNLIIGLAVLALGLILLMLGIGIRTKETEYDSEMTIPEDFGSKVKFVEKPQEETEQVA